MNIENKVVVVTGGARGIGLALAKRFLLEKAKIIILVDLNFDDLKLNDNKFVYKKCDVTDENNINFLIDVESVLKEFDCTMDNVVEETWFVTDMHECMTQVQELFAARQAIYGKPPEVAQTLVQVVALVDPSFKIEIKCVAITD